MKLITFTQAGHKRLGAVTKNGQQVVDLNYAYQEKLKREGKYRYKEIAEAYVPSNMKALIEGGEDSISASESAMEFGLHHASELKYKVVYDRTEVKLEAPLDNPGKMICVGHNYEEHIREMGRELPEYPVLFTKFANTIIGPEDDIPYFPISEQFDYEAEFAFVVGKQAWHVSEEDALDYVAGYTIINDVTYRDIQRRTIQWLQGKTVEGSAPMGPWVITTDELKDPAGLELVLTVNGEERQRSNTSNHVFTVQKLVAYLSSLVTLEPGDVILTGTPAGVGDAMEPQGFLKDGDIVRIDIDKVGTLENKVALQKELK